MNKELSGTAKKFYAAKRMKDMDSIMRRWCEFQRNKLGSMAGPESFKEGSAAR